MEAIHYVWLNIWQYILKIYKFIKIYGNFKAHKTLIKRGWNTALEDLSIFVEKAIYGTEGELQSRITDTNHMLDIIDNLNNSNVCPE